MKSNAASLSERPAKDPVQQRRQPQACPGELKPHHAAFLGGIIARQIHPAILRQTRIYLPSRQRETFIGPVRRSAAADLLFLLRRQRCICLRRDALRILAQGQDHVLVPDLVQAEALAAPAKLDVIAALVVAVGGMQRLMHIPHKMDQKAQRFHFRRSGSTSVGEDARITIDLRHHAIAAGTIAGRVVTAGSDLDIDVMPGAGVGPVAPDFVGPAGIQHHHGASLAAQQRRHLRPCRRRQMPHRNRGHHLMAKRRPGKCGGRRQ